MKKPMLWPDLLCGGLATLGILCLAILTGEATAIIAALFCGAVFPLTCHVAQNIQDRFLTEP